MEIKNMKKGDWGKVRAFFDLVVEEIVIKGFKLVEGTDGMFVGFPSAKGKDDEYYPTVYTENKTLKQEINKLAVDVYKGIHTSADPIPF